MAASKCTLVCVVLLLILLCLLVFEDNSECSSEHGYCFHGHANDLKETRNRKMIAALKEKKEALNAGLHGAPLVTSNNGKNSLRKIPSGPDPLHHNGGNPNKPRTP